MSNSTLTLVISDIHLGSVLSNANTVTAFLNQTTFDRLILLGDIFDGIHLFRFKKDDWDLLNQFQKFIVEGKEIIWIRGNHDVVDDKMVPQLKGVKFLNEFCWENQSKKYCAIHGHQFDHMAVKNPAIKKVTGKLHSIFAAYMRHKKTASVLDKLHSRVRRLSKKISMGALAYAEKNNIDYIFCAHTHMPLDITVELKNGRKINYLNSGSWIQKPFTYISIDNSGPKLEEFKS